MKMAVRSGKSALPFGATAVLGWIAFFTVVSNVLILVMPMYMTQVYDRVIPSNSIETLIYLSLLAVVALAVFGAVETVRQKLAAKLGARYELATLPALLRAAASGTDTADLSGPAQKVGTVKRFITSPSFISLFDLPFAPFFLGLMFLVHATLGWLTVAGMFALTVATLLNQWATGRSMEKASQSQAQAGRFAADALGRVEDVRAMGMGEAMVGRWFASAYVAAEAADRASHINAGFYGLTRFVRQTLQMLVLGTGAYLVITGRMSASLIFAASIVSSRALLPVEQLIGAWKQIVEAYRAKQEVDQAVASVHLTDNHRLELPEPKGVIDARKVSLSVGANGAGPALLNEVDFRARPGELVALIGASGSGKSTLARVLAGGVAPTSGEVRLDGFSLAQWPAAHRGRFVGYLGQETVLLEGTVAENISRFTPGATDEQIIAAAQAAQAHEFIGSLPDGYNTRVGTNGQRLSGGQTRRIGLARALYGSPRILILDEPNSYLDSAGEEALLKTLQDQKQRGSTVIVVTHRANILQIASQIFVMDRGRLMPFAPKAASEPVPLRPAATIVPSHHVIDREAVGT